MSDELKEQEDGDKPKVAKKVFRRLPFDVARCYGEDCPDKLECLRFLNLKNLGDRTPMFKTLMKDGKCDSIIHVCD